MVKLDKQGRGNGGEPDEKAEKPRPPSEPPVPNAATKLLKTPGKQTTQASSSLGSARQARG